MLTRSTQKQLIPFSLATLLSCTAITWIATTAINPSITLAKPVEYNLPIYRQPQESYNQFMQRAENLARNTINSRLKQDPSLDEIKVIIVGENEGAIAPLLAVKANRQGWQSAPEVQRWATYFPDSKLLLGFDRPVVIPGQTQPPAQPPTAENPSSPTPEGGQPAATGNNNPSAQTPQGEQPSQPQQEQVPLLADPPQERQRNPLPVPTQRLRNAGNQFPFVDRVDVQQLRPDLLNQ